MAFLTGRYLGKYAIQTEIGRGGMGIVYKGFDTVLQRPVAVKVLPPALAVDQDFVRRFQREAILAARLHHPNIVIVHDVGEQEGIHYIVMDFLSGQTLDAWMQQQGPMPPVQANPVVQQIASALDYAHDQGIIHRDIKPSNIMLGANGHVTLMDFGLVRATEGTGVTRSGILIGTPEYMAPEQVMGQPADQRTDVYAFGVVVYQLLTGQVPFPRTTPPAIFHAHVYESPPLPHSLRPDLTPAIETVVLKALAKQPAQRYAQAGALAADFATALEVKTPGAALAAVTPVAAATAAPATVSPSPLPRRAGTPPPAGAGRPLAPPPAAAAGRRHSWLPLLIGLTAGALLMVAAALVLTLGRGQPPPTAGSTRTTPASLAVVSPTSRPTQAAVVLPTATHPATPVPKPTQTPTSKPTTAPPTRPPPPTATAVPTATPIPPPSPTPPPRPTTPPPPARPGSVLDGEQDLTWRRGDQPYGTLTRSSEQAYAGKGAWKLDYDFPAVADNFVVWQLRPAVRLPSQATGLTAWVYGDGSGHFLNVWLMDAGNEVRAYSFGRINHQGWQQMTAPFDDQAGWPNGHISGPDNGRLDAPAALYGLVLDGVPDGQASQGAIFLDEVFVTPVP